MVYLTKNVDHGSGEIDPEIIAGLNRAFGESLARLNRQSRRGRKAPVAVGEPWPFGSISVRNVGPNRAARRASRKVGK